MEKRLKILFVGHGGVHNRGCEAIIRTTITMLNKEFDFPEIAITSLDYPHDSRINFGSNVKLIPATEPAGRRSWRKRLLKFPGIKSDNGKPEKSPIMRALEKADVVLAVGGDNFTIEYGFPASTLEVNRMVIEKKKRLVIWAASIGPFPVDDEAEIIFDNLRAVDMITARESATMDYLKQAGLTKNIYRTADPGFLLVPQPIRVRKVKRSDGNVLGVNISPFVEKYRNKSRDNDIIEEVSDFLLKIVSDKDLDIFLIPHEMIPNHWNNDYLYMELIYQNVKNTGRVTLIPPIYNAAETKFIISNCRFFIGARTHSVIAALSSGVPALSIGYSMKAKGINRDIFGNEDLLLLTDDFSAERLYEKFHFMYLKEQGIRHLLDMRIPQIKELAAANVKYLRKLLTG